MTKLFLDDLREPPGIGWVVVRNYAAFVRLIETYGVPEIISFDHDLADEHYQALTVKSYEILAPAFKEKTGADCVRFLLERGEFPQLAILHTGNPVGADRMQEMLEGHCEVRRQFYTVSR